MERRNFIASVIGGLAALTLTGEKKANEIKPDPNEGTWYLTHKESRSGLRATDIRIVIDDKAACEAIRSREGREVLENFLKSRRS